MTNRAKSHAYRQGSDQSPARETGSMKLEPGGSSQVCVTRALSPAIHGRLFLRQHTQWRSCERPRQWSHEDSRAEQMSHWMLYRLMIVSVGRNKSNNTRCISIGCSRATYFVSALRYPYTTCMSTLTGKFAQKLRGIWPKSYSSLREQTRASRDQSSASGIETCPSMMPQVCL